MNWTFDQLVTLFRDIKKKRWTGKVILHCHFGSVKVKKEIDAEPVEEKTLPAQ